MSVILLSVRPELFGVTLRRNLRGPRALPDFEEERPRNRLVEQWQAGGNREENFRQIFLTYYRPVYAFFLRRGFPAEECYDLSQDTFLRVSKSLQTFRHESSFESWLFKIAANIYRNKLREQAALKREAQEVSLEELTDPAGAREGSAGAPLSSPESGPLTGMLEQERQRLLRSALESLPAQMRRCVLLRIDQDLRYREIADLLRVSIDTVKAHLYQARQQLKGKLGDYFGDVEL